MGQEEIIGRLREVMKRSSQARVDWNTVGPDTTIQSLGFDSLSILDLIYDVQQEFGLDFEAGELARIKTVREFADFLESKKRAAN